MFRGFILACLCARIASYPLNPPPTERSDASYTLIFQGPAGLPTPKIGVVGVLSTTGVALGAEVKAAVPVSIANWFEWLDEKTSQALRATKTYWAVALTEARKVNRAVAEAHLRAFWHYTTEHPAKVLLSLVAFGFLVKMMIWVIPNLVNIIMQIILISFKMMEYICFGIKSLVVSILVGMMRCVIQCLGFGVLGPIRGSFAAAWQSACYAGFIARGSVFACLQSIGMIWR